MLWHEVVMLVFGKYDIGMEDEPLLDAFLRNVRERSLYFHHLYFHHLSNLESYLDKVLAINSQFDPQLVHYVDVVQRNVSLGINAKVDIGEITQGNWHISSL